VLSNDGSLNGKFHGKVRAETVRISLHSELFFKEEFLIQ
jgi:hypothetical protein